MTRSPRKRFRYILTSDGTAVPCDSLVAWATWFESSYHDQCIIGHDDLALPKTTDVICVLTVFLGLDLGLSEIGPPELFETVVNGGGFLERRRYATIQEARAGHASAVRQLRAHLTPIGAN